MATQNSKSASSTGRRRGRPSNASKAAEVQSQNALLLNAAMAAASAAVSAAFGIDGGVTTIAQPQGGQSQGSIPQGSTPQDSQPQGSISQGSQSQGSTSTTSRSTASRKTRASGDARQSPGRKTDPNSKMSLTRNFYDANLKAATPLTRAEFVNAAAEKFGYGKQIANTYVSAIEKEVGYNLVRRGGGENSRGSRRNTEERAAA